MKNSCLLSEEFDAFSPVYDDITVNELQYDAHIKIPEEMLSLKKLESATVLDLGCGTGLSSLPFIRQGYQVHGVDLSAGMLEQAKKHPFASLTCSDLETDELNFDQRFDYICCLGVMEFIKESESFIKKCNSLLKDGGIMGITFPLNIYSEAELTLYSYTPDEALNLLQRCGFRVEEMMLFTGYQMPEEDINYLGVIVRN